MNTRVHGKVLSLSYHATVMLEKLFSSNARFPTDVFHDITGIANVLKNAHDQNEQTIPGDETKNIRSRSCFLIHSRMALVLKKTLRFYDKEVMRDLETTPPPPPLPWYLM